MVGKKYKAGLIETIFLCLVILKSACNLLQPKCNSMNAFKLLLEGRGKNDHDRSIYYTMRTTWLQKFLRQNYEWVKKVLMPFVQKKKQVWEEFLEYVGSEQYRCDEVGLFLFARMFHIQIAVVVNELVWTTHCKQDLRQCDIVLGYKGNCEFVLLKDFEPSDEPLDMDITEIPQDSMLAPTPPAPVQSVPVKPKVQRKAVDLTKETDRKKKDKRNQKRREQRKNKKANKVAISGSYELHSKDNTRKTRNSKKAGFYSTGKSVTRAISTKHGALSVVDVTLPKRNKRSKSYTCYWCKKVFPQHKELNQHIMDDHPNDGFHCRYCGQNFKSYSGRYKHIMIHIGFKYQCKTCEKIFRYPYELRDHEKLHTNLVKFYCKEQDCESKSYSTKKALQQHMQVHDDKVFTCDVCQKTFNTKGYLQQHFRIHDKNVVAKCGKKCKNPTARKKHQKDCTPCGAKKRKLHPASG